MIEVGESTGALAADAGSVAEFYEEDVNTRMTAALLADRAGDHDFYGQLRGVRVGCVVSADLLVGGFDSCKRSDLI